jgi:hypothetical protein
MVGRWAEGRGNNRQVPAGPTGVGGKGAVATYWLPRSTLSGGRHWLATHKAPRLPYGGSRGSSPIRDLKKRFETLKKEKNSRAVMVTHWPARRPYPEMLYPRMLNPKIRKEEPRHGSLVDRPRIHDAATWRKREDGPRRRESRSLPSVRLAQRRVRFPPLP